MPTPGIAGGEKLKTVPAGSRLSSWFKRALDGLILFAPAFALIPGFQRYPEEGVVTGPDIAEQTETDDAGGVLDPRRVCENLLHLSRGRACAFQRCGIGKLHIDVEVPLVFIGQEAGGQMAG